MRQRPGGTRIAFTICGIGVAGAATAGLATGSLAAWITGIVFALIALVIVMLRPEVRRPGAFRRWL